VTGEAISPRQLHVLETCFGVEDGPGMVALSRHEDMVQTLKARAHGLESVLTVPHGLRVRSILGLRRSGH